MKRLAALCLLMIIHAAPSDGVGAGRAFERRISAPSIHDTGRRVRIHLPASYGDPNASGRRYPVVYLLHGFPGRSSDWFGRGAADRTADTLMAGGEIPEVILVCPDGNRGFFGRTLYADSYDGSFRMDAFMTRDLVHWVDSTFRTQPDPAHRGVIGLSDGGTGALNLLFKHPDVFGGAGSHSAGLRIRHEFGMTHVVGPARRAAAAYEALNPLDYLRREDARVPSGTIYFDCGRDDPDVEDNRALHALLDSLGVAHTYREYPGSHTWKYWRTHLRESLVAVTRRMP